MTEAATRLPVDSSRQLALYGLLGYEVTLAAYALPSGWGLYAWTAVLGAAVLAVALVLQHRGVVAPAWAFWVLAGITLTRVLDQTSGADVPALAYVGYLLPVGFASASLATWRPAPRLLALGLCATAVVHVWFAIFQSRAGVEMLVVANLAAAVGVMPWAHSVLTEGTG